MNITYVTAKDWAEFEKRFPGAASFLHSKNLSGEFQYFRSRKNSLTVVEALRLAELEVHACHDRGDYDCPVEEAALESARLAYYAKAKERGELND